MRVSAIERRTDVVEWDIRQIQKEKSTFEETLHALVTDTQEIKVTLARIGERLGLSQ